MNEPKNKSRLPRIESEDSNGTSANVAGPFALFEVAEELICFEKGFNTSAQELSSVRTDLKPMAESLALIFSAFSDNPAHDGVASAASACFNAHQALEDAFKACGKAIDAMSNAYTSICEIQW